MTMTRTGANAPHKQVEQYIGSAYDNVRLVADNILSVASLAAVIDEETDFNLLAGVIGSLGDSVSDLAALASADLVAISDDLVKGNYLGNRKIDIDLALNNTSTTIEVTYSKATITTNTGAVVPIDFVTTDSEGNTSIEELASFTAIYNAITDGIEAWNAAEPDPQLHIVNTEIDIINSTLPDLPTMIRFRDTDGSASSIDRVELQVYSGSAVVVSPSYFWAKTTSSLQTIANRVGDIIALGNDIDSIIALASQTDEIGYLYADREKLTGAVDSLYSELSKLQVLYEGLSDVVIVADNIGSVNASATNIADINSVAANIAAIQNAQANADVASTKATEAAVSAESASTSATTSTEQAVIATEKAAEITGVTVGNTSTGVAGGNALVTYNSLTGKFNFVVPQGVKGDKGDAFQVNSVGLFASRSLYDTQVSGFSYLSTDTSAIYFKLSATSGDWSAGAPFGKGEKGDVGNTGNGLVSTVFTSTTDGSGLVSKPGATDTYTITYTNGSTDSFTVYNGVDVTINDAGNSATEVLSSQKIIDYLSGKADSAHTHTVNDLPVNLLTSEQASALYLTQQQVVELTSIAVQTSGLNLDWSQEDILKHTAIADFEITFSNIPTGGFVAVEIKGGGDWTITLPAEVVGDIPALASGTDSTVLVFYTSSVGSTIAVSSFKSVVAL